MAKNGLFVSCFGRNSFNLKLQAAKEKTKINFTYNCHLLIYIIICIIISKIIIGSYNIIQN